MQKQNLVIVLLPLVVLLFCRKPSESQNTRDIPLNRQIDALLAEAAKETDDNKKAALYGEASELLVQKGDLRRALVAARQGERANPTHKQCLVSIAEVLLAEGKINEAESALSDALHRHPAYGRAYFVQGNLLASKNNHAAALKSYDKAEKYGFADSRLYLNHAGVALRAKKTALALARYEQTIKKFPDLAEGYLGSGIAAGQLNKKKEAKAYFEKYLSLAPHSSEAERVRLWLRKL